MIAVRSASFGTSSGGAVSVTKPAGTTAGDLLVAVHVTDIFGNTAGMTGATGFTQEGVTYSGAGSCFGKVWQRQADGSEGSSFSSGNPDTSVVMMLAITDFDGVTPFDVTATWSDGGANQTSHVAPSISPSLDGCLLVCAWGSTVGSGTPAPSYTPPGGMTLQADSGWAGFAFAALATEVLVAGGSTGTRTATCGISGSNNYTSLSLAIAPAVSAAGRIPSAISQYGGFF